MSKKNVILALLSGVLLFFSFPKYGHAAVAWVALVPLLISLRGEGGWVSVRLGFLAGLVYYVGVIHWISYVVETYGSAPAFAGYAAMLALSAFLALFVAMVAGLVAYFRRRGVPAILSAPLLWTCMEYAKSHVLTGFPWENLAYSQYAFLPVIQIGDLTGFYGITFLIVFVNVAICDLIALPKGETSRKRVGIELSAAAVMFLSVCAYGLYRIRSVDQEVQKFRAEPVVMIQGNIDQSIKWEPSFQNESLRIYLDLTRRTCQNGGAPPGLVVWPETATPFYFQDIDDRHREILRLAREGGNFLLFGSPSYVPERGPDASMNSAFMISPEGAIAGRYDKMHLVPFGEYVPLRKYLPFMSRMVAGVGDFLTGSGYTTLKTNSHQIGVLICYEAIFPEISRAYIQGGADLLVNITNDAWFGRSSAPYQHLTMTAFRAVESRRYIARAANTGISAIIDPVGRISKQTGLYEKSGVTGSVRYVRIDSVYARIGDVFAYACMAGLGIAFISTFRRRRHVRGIEGEAFKSGKPRRKTAELSLK